MKEYLTTSGETILYVGDPDFKKLDELASGYGDIWHSSLDQGYRDAFMDIVYQSTVWFWYINDFENLDECVSWRINPNGFAVRKSVWQFFGGFDNQFDGIQMQALDFGFSGLRFNGISPLYVKNLFDAPIDKVKFSNLDRYRFYFKYFKKDHALFMLYRKGIWKISEWTAFIKAKKSSVSFNKDKVLPPRELKPLTGSPTVSYIIPTMLRQEYALNLLKDIALQSYLPSQVIVVDATPANQRIDGIYDGTYPFELIVHWSQSRGSCLQRNKAIEISTGEFIIFGDDDIRIPPNFVENHIRILQTYNAGGCNGLDVGAEHPKQDLNDLAKRLVELPSVQLKVGSVQMFSNANSCVRTKYVRMLGGNDLNYEGGYGEDGDFGLSLIRIGVPVINNPFSAILHLKPPAGGYKYWGIQAKLMGKKRTKQPWELDSPVKYIRPRPSPTVLYQFYKHFKKSQISEFRNKYFFLYLFKGSILSIPFRVLNVPYRQLQFDRSIFYAKKLISLGTRTNSK